MTVQCIQSSRLESGPIAAVKCTVTEFPPNSKKSPGICDVTRQLVIESEAAWSGRRLFVFRDQGARAKVRAAHCRESSSLRLDALDPDPAEAGVFAANICLQLLLFDIERLERVYVRKL
jgi:hypothetical protein